MAPTVCRIVALRLRDRVLWTRRPVAPRAERARRTLLARPPRRTREPVVANAVRRYRAPWVRAAVLRTLVRHSAPRAPISCRTQLTI
eukprot:3725359-Rhodomonas_salina.1